MELAVKAHSNCASSYKNNSIVWCMEAQGGPGLCGGIGRKGARSRHNAGAMTSSPHDAEIAQAAARMVVEDGLEYGPAKRRAVKLLGLPTRTPLPDNDVVEDAVREHIALFCADTQPAELRALRELALEWMERLAAFRPHLGGAVWHGTATRLSDIYLQLFCDDPKLAEISLINQGVNYEPGTLPGLHGQPVDVLSVACPHRALGLVVGVHLLVYDLDDLRGALRLDRKGRAPRGDVQAVRRLLENET